MSKPNLPPLPQMDVGVSGQVKFAYSQEALTAYAEEAVRQALAELGKAISAQANIQRFNYQTHGCNPYYEGMADGLDVAEQKVLAAIPETRDG